MGFQFKKATKTNARLRLALAGPAGHGKTYSALAIATHLTENGRVAVIDTERGSASKYADIFSFDTLQLDSFSPSTYVEAIRAAENDGYDVIVIDSLSHAWMGKDGALEQKDLAIKRDSRKNDWTAWRDVTPMHNAMVDAIVGSRCHIIATLRAKTEYVVEPNERGKMAPRKLGLAPVQRDGLEYEFDLWGMLNEDNELVVHKTRCSALAGKVIPKPGERLAKVLHAWLSDGAPAPKPEEPPQVFETFLASVERMELPGEAVQLWIRHRGDLAKLSPAFKEAAWKALCEGVERVGKMKNAKVWLKRAIAEEDARAQAPESDEGSDNMNHFAGAEYQDEPATAPARRVPDQGPLTGIPVPEAVRDALVAHYGVRMDAHGALADDVRLTVDQGVGLLLDLEADLGFEDQARAEVAVRHACQPKPQGTEFRRLIDFTRWHGWIRKASSLQYLDDLDATITTQVLANNGNNPWKTKEGQGYVARLREAIATRRTELTPKPPGGGAPKPPAPAASEDEERAAIAAEANGSAATAASDAERFAQYVASKGNPFELEHGLAKHLPEYRLDADTVIRIAVPRFVEVSQGTKVPMTPMQATNAVRAILNRRKRKAA